MSEGKKTVSETSVNRTVAKFIGGLFGMERNNAPHGSRVRWLTTRAVQCLWRDVSCSDDARKQARKIKFDHRCMDARTTVEIEAPSIGLKQVKGRFCVFWAVFLPRYEHTIVHCHAHLNSTDNRTRGKS